MVAIGGREVAVRPEQRLIRLGNYTVGLAAVAFATGLTSVLALMTALRPDPWYDARYAIPLAGIILGNVLNAASLALDALLAGVVRFYLSVADDPRAIDHWPHRRLSDLSLLQARCFVKKAIVRSQASFADASW
jgi:hypothetical protein